MSIGQSSDKPLGVCVIGLGIGRRYVALARTRSDTCIASLCAEHAGKVEEYGRANAVPFTSVDYRAAIDRPEVDLVVVASPDRQHLEQAAFALGCGKHVLVEKPLATRVQDAARLVELAEESGRTLAVGHNYRFIPQFVALKALVERGEIGGVYLAESSYVQDFWGLSGRGPDYWRFRDPQDMFLGAGVHLVDFLTWCLGPVGEVQAYANSRLPFYPSTENYVASLRFESGAIGQVVIALGSKIHDRFVVAFRLYGENGQASADNQEPMLHAEQGDAPADAPTARPVEKTDSFALELGHFVECVREGARPLVGVREGARAVGICVAANRSVAEGRPIQPELR